MARRIGANKRRELESRRIRQRRNAGGGLAAVGRALRTVTLVAGIGGAAIFSARTASAWIRKSDMFVVQNIRVRGIALCDTAEVLARADCAAGTHLKALDIDGMASRLRRIPFVQKVRIKRSLPHTVDIIVTERMPVAMVNAGEIYLVDRDGVLMPMAAGRYFDIPVVSGVRDTADDGGQRRLTEKSRLRLLAVLDALRAVRNSFPAGVSQVDLGGDDIVRLRLAACPTRIELDNDHIAQKMEYLRRLMELRQRQGAYPPRAINLRCSHIAYVRETAVSAKGAVNKEQSNTSGNGGTNG